MANKNDLVRLGGVYVDQQTSDKIKRIGEQEKRTMTRQASYVLEKWAKEQK